MFSTLNNIVTVRTNNINSNSNSNSNSNNNRNDNNDNDDYRDNFSISDDIFDEHIDGLINTHEIMQNNNYNNQVQNWNNNNNNNEWNDDNDISNYYKNVETYNSDFDRNDESISNNIFDSPLSSSSYLPRTMNSITDQDRNNNNINNNYNSNEQDNDDLKDIESIDAFLAKELNALSFAARESLNEEIHGLNVDQIYWDKVKKVEETPELLRESFMELKIELNKLQLDSYAYNRFLQFYSNTNGVDNVKSTAYINTDEFRIIFLRCELFDVTKAARRLINFVELMYELYGDIGLQRRIRLDDLSDAELQVLKAGYEQILPGRDRAGRRISVCIAYNSKNPLTAESRLRIFFYMQMSLTDDIETQRKGGVMVFWYQHFDIFKSFKVRRKIHARASKCALVRVGAMHVCIPEELKDNSYMNLHTVNNVVRSDGSLSSSSSSQSNETPANIIKSMVALSVGAKIRSKLRIHTGSAMECLYALQSFGIPSDLFPLAVGTTSNNKRIRKEVRKNKYAFGEDNTNIGSNKLELNNHRKWLKLCQLKESNLKSCGKKWKYLGNDCHQQIIECPNHSDIISGRGMDLMRHPGNTVLRSIVVSKLDEYIGMKKYKETIKLTLAVVHLLKNKYGARFLKEESIETNGKLGCWVEVSDEEARIKVRIAFRDKSKRQQSQQQIQQHNQILQPIMMTSTTDGQINNTNAVVASGSTNTTKAKEKIISSNMQQEHEQLPLVLTSAKKNSPINVFSTSLSLSNSTSLLLEQQKNNTDSSYHNQQIQRQQINDNTDSSTSIFLSMNGFGSGCSDSASISDCICTGKKRQLQPKSSYYFDWMKN